MENDIAKDFEERSKMFLEVSTNILELDTLDQIKYAQEFVNFTDKIKPLYAKLKMNKGETFFMKM